MFKVLRFLLTGEWHKHVFHDVECIPVVKKPSSFIDIDCPTKGFTYVGKCACGVRRAQTIYLK